MSLPCPDSFIALAARLADASGPVLRRYFRSKLAVDDKADASPVTIADREAEQAMRALIEAAFPDHGIFGEEFGTVREGADFLWVLDPIDGTKSFITGKPLFGTLIALLHQGRPILGVIDQPILNERWVGAAGHATRFNGEPIEVRSCAGLASAVLYTTSPYLFAPGDFPAYDRVRQRVKLPMFGGDCYQYGLLASGFADLVIESGLKPYDYCAQIPIIQGAGGVITDWRGEALGLHSSGQVIAAGDRRAHAQALALLAGDDGAS